MVEVPAKACGPMLAELVSILIFINSWPAKARAPMLLTLSGIMSSVKSPNSKASSPILTTLLGIVRLLISLVAKTLCPILVKLLGLSKMRESIPTANPLLSVLPDSKALSPILVTPFPIITCDSVGSTLLPKAVLKALTPIVVTLLGIRKVPTIKLEAKAASPILIKLSGNVRLLNPQMEKHLMLLRNLNRL